MVFRNINFTTLNVNKIAAICRVVKRVPKVFQVQNTLLNPKGIKWVFFH